MSCVTCNAAMSADGKNTRLNAQCHSLSLYALLLNSLKDAYGRIHSLPSLLTGSAFGNSVVI